MVKQLSSLDDSVCEAGVGTKIYPGLVGHIFPSNKFRNTFRIQPPSPYVARELVRKEENRKENRLQTLMNDLLDTPKARSFAGLIWEPLLSTKKMKSDAATITIVGSALPAGASDATTMVLLHESASFIDFTKFSTLKDYLMEAKEYVEGKKEGDFCLFAKAESDSFAAIDGIIVMVRKEDSFVIAALQLTVAKERHPVLQSMIIDFVCACREIGKDKPQLQLWFLQPEECLSSFRFVKLQQAMEFDVLTFPSTKVAETTPTWASSVRKSTRKRNRVDYLGDWAPRAQPNGRLSSNDRAYWDEEVRTLDQFVGIVHIKEDTSKGCEENPLHLN